MKAIEFETCIKKRSISIPEQFQNLDNIRARVILLFSESEKQGNYDKNLLFLAFDKAQQKGIFKNIDNSVAWQKQVRDEWE
jgi:hypothetical protein